MESRRNGPQLSSRHDDDDDECLTVTVTPYSSDIPTGRGLLHPMHVISLVRL